MNNPNTSSGETSIIAKETTIKGDLEFVGTLIVEGCLESEVKGAEITLQKSGKLMGTLNVRTLNCHGQIEGDVNADLAIIHSGATVSGAINVTSLEIKPGAIINGKISMKAPQTASIKQIDDKIANVKK